MHNKNMTPSEETSRHTPWLYIMIGALLTLQVVQFVLIALLYLYIHSVEGRIETEIRESKQEVFLYMDRKN